MSTQRHEYRLAVSLVDKGTQIEETLVLSRHSGETIAHLTLRVLAWLLLWEERLRFGAGVGETPDLLAEDLTGRVRTFVACGAVDADLVRKEVQHNRDAAAHVVFAESAHRDRFVAEVMSWGGRRPRGWEQVTLWTIDTALLAALIERPSARQRWAGTLVGDHFYLEVDGNAYDGAVTRG